VIIDLRGTGSSSSVHSDPISLVFWDGNVSLSQIVVMIKFMAVKAAQTAQGRKYGKFFQKTLWNVSGNSVYGCCNEPVMTDDEPQSIWYGYWDEPPMKGPIATPTENVTGIRANALARFESSVISANLWANCSMDLEQLGKIGLITLFL
jgi:hypothetical protein